VKILIYTELSDLTGSLFCQVQIKGYLELFYISNDHIGFNFCLSYLKILQQKG